MLTTTPRDYSFIAPVYDHVFNKVLNEGHKKLGALLRKKKKTPGFKVLEVGVGSGLTLDYLPSGIEYHGVDINTKMLNLAQTRMDGLRKKNISLSIMDAQRLTFRPGTFDVVMAASLLSAVNDPVKVMKEMIRVTKKGGYIAVITNLRENSYRSDVARRFDPLTKKFLGFRTDMSFTLFSRFKELELVESSNVNNLLGFSLSTYLLFRKK